MKAAIIKKYGNEPLQIEDISKPVVGDNDVLVEVHSASINPVDFKIKNGDLKMLLHYKMPLTLGQDFAGIVTAVGNNVDTFKIGSEVFGRVDEERIGSFAEYVVIDQKNLALKPKNLTFEEAASIPLVGLTSYQALNNYMSLEKNQKILIQAGSGGVGTFAIQLAKAMGAYVATTVSDKGIDLVKSLGVDQIINYKKEKFNNILKNYDDVFDTLGGEALAQSFDIVKKGGHIVSISGVPDEKFARAWGLGFFKRKLFKLASGKITKLSKERDINYDFLFMHPDGNQLETIRELIEDGLIVPVIDKIYTLDNINEAMSYSESGRAKGKIIIKIK